MSKPLHVIYITGIGDIPDPKGQIWAVKRWPRYGVVPEVFLMRWADKEPWPLKFKRLLDRIDELVAEGHKVGLVAASAGASVAVNAFYERQDKIVGIVLIAGKVNRPEAIHSIHYSKNPSLPPSVKRAVKSLANLDDSKKKRILSRFGIYDELVKKPDSFIPGAKNQTVPTLGHFSNIAFQVLFGAKSFLKFLKDLPD